MNGVHDMGGMDGFGKVEAISSEPPFHDMWEGRVLALSRAMQATGEWNIDVARYGIEMLPPAVYLASSYYKRWFLRLENLCLANGLVSSDELAAARASGPGRPLKGNVLTAGDVDTTLVRRNYSRTPTAPAQFRVGQRVCAKNMHPGLHTRLPRFVRGHYGVIERIQGCHVFPDAVVAEHVKRGEWLYTVTFDGRELWGADADPTVQVSIEAFEPYLEPSES
jgi:nitrile hydratase beta subunit